VVSPCGADLEAGVQQTAELAALPGWWALPAVRSGRVFVVDHSLFSRPGPRSALNATPHPWCMPDVIKSFGGGSSPVPVCPASWCTWDARLPACCLHSAFRES
jgi:hypothetical protein